MKNAERKLGAGIYLARVSAALDNAEATGVLVKSQAGRSFRFAEWIPFLGVEGL